jgi:hypothetical protein
MAAAVGDPASMSAEDMEICRRTISILLSPKYKDKSLLFRDPFDLSQVPGYLDICQRQLDISTVSKNLEDGIYKSRDEFFSDAMLIFENARKYHTGRPQTLWIVKPAKEMLKVVEREKRNADKKASKVSGMKKSPLTKNDIISHEKKAPSFKLKLNPVGEKVYKDVSPAEVKPTAAKAKPSQPKLKLKLSLSQKASKPIPTVNTETPKMTPSHHTHIKLETKQTSPNTATTKVENKIQVKLQQNPRGKELPKGVTAPQKQQKTATKIKTVALQKPGSRKPSLTSLSAPMESNRSHPGMTPGRKEQCMKVLSGLKRRKLKDVNWFLQPVALKQMDDYRAKIKFPMDIATMSSKLEKNQYTTIGEFVLDMRRIFANCLRFNTSVKDSLRPVAVDVLSAAEDLMAFFIAKPDLPAVFYPQLIYCWKLCVSILDTLCNLTNPNDGLPTAYFFLHPVSVYCGGNFPVDYLEKVPRPMDFGTVTSLLIEEHYQTVEAFAADCRLVVGNCMSYYGGRADGREIIEQANRLNGMLSQQLDALTRYDQSPTGAAAKSSASSYATVKLEKPPEALLMSILAEMRSVQYTDKATQVANLVVLESCCENANRHFQNHFLDY